MANCNPVTKEGNYHTRQETQAGDLPSTVYRLHAASSGGQYQYKRACMFTCPALYHHSLHPSLCTRDVVGGWVAKDVEGRGSQTDSWSTRAACEGDA